MPDRAANEQSDGVTMPECESCKVLRIALDEAVARAARMDIEATFWRAQAEKAQAVIAACGRALGMLTADNPSLAGMCLRERVEVLMAREQASEGRIKSAIEDRDYSQRRREEAEAERNALRQQLRQRQKLTDEEDTV